MKYLSASANTINFVQLACLVAAVVAFPAVKFTSFNVFLIVLSFYLYSIVGISLTLHRHYSHKSFKFRAEWIKWIATFVAILAGRGSPLGWVYIHRIHHSKSDTTEDPHSPQTIGFKLFGFKHLENHEEKMKVFLVKDMMSKEQLFINNYYFGIILVWLAFLAVINLELIYFTYVIPVLLIQLSQNSFNFFAHGHGYRNFDNRDQSTNNIWLWPFIWGDAWHNNHHANAAKLNTQVKWWELDPATLIVKVIGK